MKAITLQDDSAHNPHPWLTLVEYKLKTIESRKNWIMRNHRGQTLFTGSKSSRTPNAGLAACVANVVDIMPMTEAHEDEACIKVYVGAWALILEDLRWLTRKFPVKGALGVFDVDVPSDVSFYAPTPEQLHPKAYPAYLRYYILKNAPR